MFRAVLVFNKSLLKAADTGVSKTERASGWLATLPGFSNACSNSGKGVGISPLETAAVYLKKYIVRVHEGVGIINLSHRIQFLLSLTPTMTMSLCFSVLHPPRLSHGCWKQAPKGDFNFQKNSVLRGLPLPTLKHSHLPFPEAQPLLPPIAGSKASASLRANPTTTGRGQQAFSPM